MVTPPREAKKTVAFIDEYCWIYRSLFDDVRNFESLKYLYLGMLSEIKRKSLPEIAKVVGLKDQGQSLHHFLRNADWNIKAFRETRLWLTKLIMGEGEIILIIDKTGEKKKGKTTDYVTRQYIGQLGKVVEGITYRLSWVSWVKCILRYSPAGERVERTTKAQRTQRSISPIYVKLITPRTREPKSQTRKGKKAGMERTTKAQRTQRSISPIYVKLITPRTREPKSQTRKGNKAGIL
jgi:SRSO17 transposase